MKINIKINTAIDPLFNISKQGNTFINRQKTQRLLEETVKLCQNRQVTHLPP
jgi:hypothetical protein